MIYKKTITAVNVRKVEQVLGPGHSVLRSIADWVMITSLLGIPLSITQVEGISKEDAEKVFGKGGKWLI